MVTLTKINSYLWQIPKTPPMRVPGLVFASERLKQDIEKDLTLSQLQNVATLPGIQKAALAMPDTHSGYGFPIGGVAAFDKKEGVISPGGVGYDINCLVGDARILTEFGSTQAIEEFEVFPNELEMIQHQQIVRKIKYDVCLSTLNLPLKKIEPKPISYFMYRDSHDVYELTLKSGLTIKATAEHPFLTQEGMKPLCQLYDLDLLAVNLFTGISWSDPLNIREAIIAKVMGN